MLFHENCQVILFHNFISCGIRHVLFGTQSNPLYFCSATSERHPLLNVNDENMSCEPWYNYFHQNEPLSQLCSCPSERPAIRTDISFGIWVGGMHLIFEKKRKPVNVPPRCVITSRPPSDTNRQELEKAPKSQSKNSITPSFVYYAHRPLMGRSIKSDHTKTGAHSNMVNINGRLWMEEEQCES